MCFASVIVEISLPYDTLFCIFLYLSGIYIVLPELWTSQNCQNPGFCMLSCQCHSWCPEFSRLFSASVIVEIIMPCCSGGTIILMFTTWGKNNHNCYMLINTRPHADSYILLIYHTREEGSRVKWSLWSGIFSRISRAFSRLLFVCCTLHLSFQGHYIYNSELSLDTVTRNADRQLRHVAASIPFIRKHQVSVHKFRFF